MKTILQRIKNVSNLDSEMLRGTAWMIFSYGVKLSLQLISFILLARTLGPESFGVYMAILSFTILLEPFFDLGAYNLVVRDITRHGNTAAAVGDSLLVSSLVLPLGIVVLFIGHAVLFPSQLLMSVMEVGVSQFIGGRSISLGIGANIGNATISRNAILEIINGSIRLCVVVVLFLIDGDLSDWIHLQLLHSCLLAVVVFTWMKITHGIALSGQGSVFERAKAGVHFAVANAARNVNTELDKIMIYEYSTVAATGIYAAAVRFAVMSCIPVNALLTAVYRHFFIQGEKGYTFSRAYAAKLVPATASYGGVAGLCLWFLSDYIILLLGDSYEESASAIRFLAFFPIIQSILLPFADALSGAGLQKVRSNGTVISMVLNVTLNFVLIQVYGWRGAVFATLISQSFLLLYVVIYARRYL